MASHVCPLTDRGECFFLIWLHFLILSSFSPKYFAIISYSREF